MSSPISNSNTVIGYQYKTHFSGISGSSEDLTHIFVPSMKLILENGKALRSETPGPIKKSMKATDKYCEEHEDNSFNEAELRKIQAEANQKAMKEVQLPLEDVQAINALLEKREALEKEKSSIDETIKTLISKFNLNRNTK